MKFKIISSQQTYPVRHPILRPGKPLIACSFEGDDLPETQHIGLYDRDNLIGVVSLFSRLNEQFQHKIQLQLRGMAILENYQKLGYGAALIQESERIAKSKKAELIWFNARQIAVPFYERMGYNVGGNEFSIGDIGIHYLMYRELTY
jgi:GNAT superfamily N-acetyltransferase